MDSEPWWPWRSGTSKVKSTGCEEWTGADGLRSLSGADDEAAVEFWRSEVRGVWAERPSGRTERHRDRETETDRDRDRDTHTHRELV